MTGVAAVILTYNRRDLLRQCIKAVRSQTTKVASIFVLDNGGTDGSTKMLLSDYPQVEVCRLADNTGAAGGFSIATRIAIASGAQYVWLMDDDVIPEPDALKHLVAAQAELQASGCEPPFLISLARSPDGILTNVPDIDRSKNNLAYSDWPRQLEYGLAPVRRATFVSILIPERTFRTHGYPLGSMFIWGEDSEFTLRTTTDQPGYLVGRSRVTHVRSQPGRLDIRTEQSDSRLAWHSFLVRNTIYTLCRHQSYRSAIRYTLGIILVVLRLALERKFRKASILAKGILLGLTFKPDETQFTGSFDEVGIEFMSDKLRARTAASFTERVVPAIQPATGTNAYPPAPVIELGS